MWTSSSFRRLRDARSQKEKYSRRRSAKIPVAIARSDARIWSVVPHGQGA